MSNIYIVNILSTKGTFFQDSIWDNNEEASQRVTNLRNNDKQLTVYVSVVPLNYIFIRKDIPEIVEKEIIQRRIRLKEK